MMAVSPPSRSQRVKAAQINYPGGLPQGPACALQHHGQRRRPMPGPAPSGQGGGPRGKGGARPGGEPGTGTAEAALVSAR